ncbi:MAG: alpha-amylase family glycosyl hydrolase [Fusobacteriota bacterium]
MKEGIKIYNLFPRLEGDILNWIERLDEIKNMGFNFISLNPIFKKNYHQDIYSPVDFYSINEEFMRMESSLTVREQFIKFLDSAKAKGIGVILEMILTHTAMESNLLIEHPEWYKVDGNKSLKRYDRPSDDEYLEYGSNLVEINNNKESGIWKYWLDLFKYYIELGVSGFKITEACNLDVRLIEYLLKKVKEIDEEIIFIGDNLGAYVSDMEDLARTGIDYLYTSLRWWDFKEIWFLEQHYRLKELTNLISFPEMYGMERISKKYSGNESASKIWYSISALINSSVQISSGYEYGYQKSLEDINEFESDYQESFFDITNYITKINKIKDSCELFKKETDIHVIESDNKNILIIKKYIKNDGESLLIFNMDFNDESEISIENVYKLFAYNKIEDISPENRIDYIPKKYHYILKPGEMRILYSKKK